MDCIGVYISSAKTAKGATFSISLFDLFFMIHFLLLLVEAEPFTGRLVGRLKLHPAALNFYGVMKQVFCTRFVILLSFLPSTSLASMKNVCYTLKLDRSSQPT